MRILIIFLAIPFFSAGQTAHVKDEKIVYEGSEKIAGASAPNAFHKIQEEIPLLIDNYQIIEQSSNSIKARGQFKLSTPYNVVRTVSYLIRLNAIQDGYEYIIDSVMFTEQYRGEKATAQTSQELLKNMGEAGKIVGDSEKILNQTDMQFQKLLARFKQRVAGGKM